MSCVICNRRATSTDLFCEYHEEAKNNLEQSFEYWKKAAGVSWDEFLRVISEADSTGNWVKEVVALLIQESVVSER